MNFWKMIAEWLKKIFGQITTTTTTTYGGINVIPVRTPYIVYGPVNNWPNLTKADYEVWMKAQNAAKLDGIEIEFFGFSEQTLEKNIETVKAQFLVLLPLARKYYQRIFLNFINWNSEELTKFSDQTIKDLLNWFKDNSLPSDYIAFQLASEWKGDTAERWCGFAETILSGYPLSWNKDSRPTTATDKYAVIDYHPSSTSSIPTNDKRLFINCDHSITIGQLSDAGVTSEKFNPEKVSTWATTVIKDKKMCVGLYGYNHKVADLETIKALGKIREVITPTPVPDPDADQTETSHNFSLPYKITKKIELVSYSASGITVKGDDRSDWKNDGTCDGESHIYVIRNGQWVGGKFDHQRVNNAIREFKNIFNGYGSWSSISPKPERGEDTAFVVVGYDKVERTNAVFFNWP